mmetsp:Transcript_19452/g.61078  ORF Transcript_19452/g.61078 Transcript_19452/m.61078 type:complete len:513 (-) Transcript_19452:58-1596(-)|eukprot:CAMPEP_0175559868 /NCGR_PEP_ID=MMETSP0096-20121207/36619_1 /TAXON_ID=311494 /ORGANISM="Alexandrium monilatum, Strain CCMP3105" /LENGTH=512 /DNA_ID=CAMNT_0016863075 /DNA_START=20 /DNA_END=1558 /DNA_ORIENTATION=+
MDLLPFSIHQELWHDAWVAATATARSRKRQVDLDVRQRVEKLLQDYGPTTERPLTLRVYGTMIKGFCVINNERARMLYADCERVVILFSHQGLAEDSKALKLPASKKPRVDALTLDLDLNRVRESETFDWTQAPLEEGTLLRLPEEQLAALPPVPGADEPSLLQQVALLDEAFPPVDAPASGPIDVVAEAARTAGTLALLTAAQEAAQGQFDLAAQAMPDQALLPFEQVTVAEEPPQKKRHRGPGKAPPPGHFLGYDNSTVLAPEEYDAWQYDTSEFTRPLCEMATHAALMPRAISFDHLGPLRSLLDPCPEDLRMAVTNGDKLGLLRSIPGGRGAGATLPEVQELLAGEGMQPETLSAILAEPPEALPVPRGGIFGGGLAASRPDPFHPYSPEAPLRSTRGALEEIAEVLRPQPHEEPPEDADGEFAGKDLPYDVQTAKIGAVLRSSLERAGTEGEASTRGVTLDDIVPLQGTDRATAAKTFAAVLVLATAGELKVMQPMPYGPIAMSWPK